MRGRLSPSIDYAPGCRHVETDVTLEHCLDLRDAATVSWINLNGMHDAELIRQLGERFGIHPLALHELYLSNVSHRMNEVVQGLTIIASLFIPLIFIAEVYGMNFERRPESKQSWGVPLPGC